MTLEGKQLIGSQAILTQGSVIQGIDPSSGERLEPIYYAGSKAEVERACELAEKASNRYSETDLDTRATFLEAIAENIESIGDSLIERAMRESGLPRARLEGERGRTCNQLRLFANIVRAGEWLDVRIDPALPERQPVPRVDLRQRHISLGPVAVFGASNFPLAFSVAGGDTASALAAGCPVIVKAHSAHPGTSELIGRAIQASVSECELDEGVFSLIYDSGFDVGQALVSDKRIKAVGFTGSRSGGTALMRIAQDRSEPIPVYAEMSSINPVFLLPEALKTRGPDLGKAFVGSLNMGAGQFCTSPGIVVGIKSAGLDAFIDAASTEIKSSGGQTMLTPGIYDAYSKGVEKLASNNHARHVAYGEAGEGPNQCQTGLFIANAGDFLADKALQEEIFGSTSLIVECSDLSDLKRVAEHLEGQLTVTLQMDDTDIDIARSLLPTLERRAGRVMVNGWPTGVEVCHAMVHGGPYPATSDSRTTSVGSAAIHRFLRPVCYQNLPEDLLPQALKDNNPLGVSRLMDGKREI